MAIFKPDPPTFQIEPPVYSGVEPFESSDIHFWQRSTKNFPLAGDFVNSHPFSCPDMTVSILLGNDPKPDGLGEHGLSLDTGTSPMTIKLLSTKNNNLTRKLQVTVRAEVQNSGTYFDEQFEYYLYNDCTTQGDEVIFEKSMDTKNITWTRVGYDANTFKHTVPVLLSTYAAEGECPYEYEFFHNTQPLSNTTTSALVLFDSQTDPAFLIVSYGGPTLLESDKQLTTYDLGTGEVVCSLQQVSTKECHVKFWIDIKSINGTMAVKQYPA